VLIAFDTYAQYETRQLIRIVHWPLITGVVKFCAQEKD